MKLGLKKNEVRLTPHQDFWKSEFEETKEKLLQETELKNSQIEHIGSTSIKEIKAKPIIDILIGIENIEAELTTLEKQLKSCGFYRLKVERPHEIVFAKFTDKTFEMKTHFIHLVDLNGSLWKDLLYFRDYLNNDEKSRHEYEQIKEAFLKKHADGINEYTDAKESFVQGVIKKRLKNNKKGLY